MGDHTLGQTAVTTCTNSSKLMTPSLSLSAYWMIWSTSALEKCSPTLAATFSNSSGPKAPVLEMSKSSKMLWRVPSLVESPPKPKMSRNALKSMSPTWPELLTMARIWPACDSMLSARMVLMSSSVETLPLPSQSKTSKTSLSLPTVSAFRFLRTYLAGSKALLAALDIRYIQYNKNYQNRTLTSTPLLCTKTQNWLGRESSRNSHGRPATASAGKQGSTNRLSCRCEVDSFATHRTLVFLLLLSVPGD